MLECVINVSEGERIEVIDRIGEAAGRALLDVHRDPDHNRSVFTLAGPDVESAAQAVAGAAVATIDLRTHTGAHPRVGALDVVPFVPLGDASFDDAIRARDRFATWAAATLGIPCFLYGPERTLPDVRRGAFHELTPDVGPSEPHPTAGATAVGARTVLVAYNLWLAQPDLDAARRVAAGLRGPAVRALGLRVGDRVQVSCNLIDPLAVGPDAVHDAVAAQVEVASAELVGLVPQVVLAAIPPDRWPALDLSVSKTIEARLSQAGLDGGSADGAGRGRGH